MEYKRYHIAILPPPEIVKQAVAVSESLQKFNPFFVLDGQTLFPHVSLYHAPFTADNIQAVREDLARVAVATPPFLLRQDTYYPEQGVWIGVRYVADKPILDLHTSVVEATKARRAEQDDARYVEKWPQLSPVQRKNIKDCGWAKVFTLYSPHLSFTKLRQPSEDILKHLPESDFSFQVERIALIERGEYGACLKRVAEFRLQG